MTLYHASLTNVNTLIDMYVLVYIDNLFMLVYNLSSEEVMPQQHPLFIKYKRDYLHELTGYSLGYLSRVATGKTLLRRSFIERMCFKLNQSEEELFLPEAAEVHPTPI